MAEWVFSQLGGEQKELRLSGWSAPFGRPRQSPVATDAITVRHADVHYPGNSKPTRHVFGHRLEPIELRGRFMDAWGGAGYADQMVRYCKAFVADGQTVMFGWDSFIAGIGLIESFEPARESGSHIAWRMVLLVDSDLFLETAKSETPKRQMPRDMAADLQAAIADAWDKTTEIPPSVKMGILDSLGALIGSINSAVAQVTAIANKLDEFEKGLVSELRRLRAGLAQLKTAVRTAFTAYENLRADLAIQSSYAADEVEFAVVQANTGKAILDVLAKIDAMDDAAKQAERGAIKGTYVARASDTWESIARQTLGSADRAGDVQAANGATAAPVPGTPYVIPR